MKKDIQIEGLGLVTYEETNGLGKKKIYIEGNEAQKLDKSTFELDGKRISIDGNFMRGVSLIYEEQVYPVTEKTQWYEFVLACLPLVLALTWGNSTALCSIFPIIGGAIGGFVGALSFSLQIILLKSFKKPLVKVGVSLICFAVTVLILFLLAFALISLL